MGLARAGTGFGASARIPIRPALVADQYPLSVRTRVFAMEALGRPLGQVLGPLFAGIVVMLAGDDAGDWRIVFCALLIPAVVTVLWSLRQSEPERGVQEQQAVLGRNSATGISRAAGAAQRCDSTSARRCAPSTA